MVMECFFLVVVFFGFCSLRKMIVVLLLLVNLRFGDDELLFEWLILMMWFGVRLFLRLMSMILVVLVFLGFCL